MPAMHDASDTSLILWLWSTTRISDLRMASEAVRVAIVGGGVAGLVVGRVLQSSARHSVVVFDAGRAPGGRIGSFWNEADEIGFDYGSPILPSSSLLSSSLPECLSSSWEEAAAEISAPWTPSGATGEALVGLPEARSFVHWLGSGLEVVSSTSVGRLAREAESGKWRVESKEGADLGEFDVVALATQPSVVQGLAEGAGLDDAAGAAGRVETEATWVGMFQFAEDDVSIARAVASAAASVGGLSVEDGILRVGNTGDPGLPFPLKVILHEGAKPGRGKGSVVAHALPKWAHDNFSTPKAEVASIMSAALQEALGLGPPVLAKAHRWSKSRCIPASSPGVDAFWSPDLSAGVCGDWCLGDGILNAIRSGSALASRIMSDSPPAVDSKSKL